MGSSAFWSQAVGSKAPFYFALLACVSDDGFEFNRRGSASLAWVIASEAKGCVFLFYFDFPRSLYQPQLRSDGATQIPSVRLG